MFHNQTDSRRLAVLAATVGALCAAAPAVAQEEGKVAPKRPTVSTAKAADPNAMVNLVNGLVRRGVFTEEEGTLLIKQAQDESYVARQAAKDAGARAEEAARTATAAAAAASPPGARHVTYVPEVVKRQLRDELRQEVMSKAQAEGWASPGKYPEWASRIRFYGDARMRYEKQTFPKGNLQDYAYDFNTLNNGKPYDLGYSQSWYPTYNVTEDRERMRLRARLGFDADLGDAFTFGMRIGTGDSSSPVSMNQTFGTTGTNFSKYALWLDRAYIQYQPAYEFTGVIGRFDNPFFTVHDMVWNRDIGFDGGAVKFRRDVLPNLTGFLNAGVFSIFNTALNAGIDLGAQAATEPYKYKSHDKWLQGAQTGFSTRFADVWSLTVAGAFYNFTGVKGRLSSVCDTTNVDIACDTDLFRPLFAQKGNTYMALRNQDLTALATYQLANGGAGHNYQYFGLASEFRPVVVSARLDNAQFEPIHVTLEGEFVKNTAFNKNEVAAIAVNNFGPTIKYSDGNKVVGSYEGGDTGYYGRLTVGNPVLRQLWDWNAHIGYKYVESDATVDAFTDADFGLGGTNLKGYFIGASLGLSANVWASARWMSANVIAGPPGSVDIVQVDLNARF
ncbi:MAG: putative porin [Rhodoplanes sp.]|uniref:putative porin n=1 Tax=Rhodoplanes sp. TaxID=1968906 RepID=UPI00184B5917|nr:putative porin [Rhodoplanes sp.]NVO18005.1 putative porin [Rhodoplanes sp.]